jgi:hypothetical protein
VGDFFTWGPTQTQELKLTLGGGLSRGFGGASSSSSPLSREHVMFRDLDSWKWQAANLENVWAAVNVTQPLKNLDLIPDDIPLIIGTNKHEGELFVHGAFPITMSKVPYIEQNRNIVVIATGPKKYLPPHPHFSRIDDIGCVLDVCWSALP